MPLPGAPTMLFHVGFGFIGGLWSSEYQGGGLAPFRGSANLPEKVSRDMGYRSDSIAVSRDMGPLSSCFSRGHF